MQFKSADNRQPQVDALTVLLARADIPRPTRQQIEQEIRNIKAGQRAEKDAAYQIEFYAANNPNVMTIHDLRVSCDGRVAQIDHLIITRRRGWHTMHQRLRRRLLREGISGYKQHRNRNTWTRDALEAGVPETAIVQMGGWGSVDMLRRYHGKLSTSELARYPTTLSKYVRR